MTGNVYGYLCLTLTKSTKSRWLSLWGKHVSQRRNCWGPLRLGFFFSLIDLVIRASLDYDEEVHQASILEEWNNMFGYEVGFVPIGVYITTETFPVENFKHG